MVDQFLKYDKYTFIQLGFYCPLMRNKHSLPSFTIIQQLIVSFVPMPCYNICVQKRCETSQPPSLNLPHCQSSAFQDKQVTLFGTTYETFTNYRISR